MRPDPTFASNRAELDQLLRQRDLALACAVLALVLAGLVLWTNAWKAWPEIEAERQALRRHHESLTEHLRIAESVAAARLAAEHEVEKLKRQ